MTGELQDSFDYLEAMYRRPIVPAAQARLARTEYLLDRLGNPHRAFKSVHVTGTCGKGSTTTMIGSILENCGYRVGVFRSPHLESYRERIAIGPRSVDERGWLDLFDRVRAVADTMEEGVAPNYDLGRVSLFEFIWAMGSLYFAQEGVDYAAVEVGLGGRLDSTNVLDSEVAIVTNVSLDHTAVLGTTVEKIAAEKAAIIKTGSSAVTAATQESVRALIRKRATAVGAPLWEVGYEVSYRVTRHDLHGEVMTVQTPEREHSHLSTRLLGLHQAANAATAVSTVDFLARRGQVIPAESVRQGLARAVFPGRFEIVSHDPLIVLDGARNEDSAHKLRMTVDDLFPEREVILLIGVLGDKDAEGIVAHLGPLAKAAVVTTPPWEGRVGDLSRLTACLTQYVSDTEQVNDPAQAFEAASRKQASGDLLLVTGSLYLVAAIRSFIGDVRASSNRPRTEDHAAATLVAGEA